MIEAEREDAEPYEPRWDASVELELERQIGLNWCWAAVVKGIVEHYGGPTRQQCEYATTFLHQKRTCCGAGAPPPRCDQPFPLDTALARYGLYAAPPFPRAVRLATLRAELERDRPVVALIRYPSSVHAVAITAVDVTNRRLGVSDPAFGGARTVVGAETFERAYEESGRWCYTMLTRPPARAAVRPTISFLRDRMPQESDPVHVPYRRGEPLEVDLYEANPYRLADGTGLRTADRFARKTVRLGVPPPARGTFRLERALSALWDEIVPRLERGFELRVVRCAAYKFEALWFTDAADPSHRADHYLIVPPSPYYLETGREYAAAELRDAFVTVSAVVLSGIRSNEAWLERLDRETTHHPDP